MSELLPKLLDFEEVSGEKRWTYELKIIFNYLPVNKLTITDYYQTKPGREMITNELILNIMRTKLHGEALRPTNYQGGRKVYKWDKNYQGKNYRLYFWYEDNSTSHLWIRNCHRID